MTDKPQIHTQVECQELLVNMAFSISNLTRQLKALQEKINELQ